MRNFLLITAFSFFIIVNSTFGQLTGNIPIPGATYPTIAAAVTALNSSGVGAGGVTFNIASGHSENGAISAITATGTLANPIVFQKSGTGANPFLNGSGAFAIRISGGDYITFDGIDIRGSYTVGYDVTSASSTDGAQYVTIKNCKIEVANVNNSVGIHCRSTGASNLAGTSSFNKFFSNHIIGGRMGIRLDGNMGLNSTGNEVGVDGGNIIIDFTGQNNQECHGIDSRGNTNYKIANNTITSVGKFTQITNGNKFLKGIHTIETANASYEIYGNTLSLNSLAQTTGIIGIHVDNVVANTVPGTGIVSIYNNILEDFSQISESNIFGIYFNARSGEVNIHGNILRNFTLKSNAELRGIGRVVLQQNSNTVSNIYNNQILNFENTETLATATNARVRGIVEEAGKESNVYGNIIRNLKSNTNAEVRGYTYVAVFLNRPDQIRVNGNQITSLFSQGSVFAIEDISWNTKLEAIGNRIDTLASSGGDAGGILLQNDMDEVKIHKNKITHVGTAGGAFRAAGIWVEMGTNYDIAYNIIAKIGTIGSGIDVVNGIFLRDGTNIKIYYNTIYLDAISVVPGNFGGHAIGCVWYPKNLLVVNNIIINKLNPVGTGKATCIKWDGTTAPQLIAQWNNNLYYAGNPSANRVIWFDGTNNDQTLAAYQSRIGTGEEDSKTEDVGFVNITQPPLPTFLQPAAINPTFVESGARHIANYIDDFHIPSGISIRMPGLYPKPGQVNLGGTAPDIGAIEGDFKPRGLLDVGITAVVSPVTSNCPTNNETFSVTLTNFSSMPHDFLTHPVTVSGSMNVSPPNNTTNFPNVIISTGTLNPGASQTVVLATGLNLTNAGTYTFNASATFAADNNPANDALQPAFVYANTLGTANINKTSICPGEIVTLTVTGGSGSLQWEVSTDGGATWANATGAGNNATPYTVTPTANSQYRARICNVNVTNVVSVTVNPVPVISNVAVTNASCTGQASGEISFIATLNGNPCTTCTWSLNGTPTVNNPISGLAAGTNYILVVTSANNCTATQTGISIGEPASLPSLNNPVITPVSCPGSADGGIDLAVGGGTGPYQVYESTLGSITLPLGNLASGTYTFYVVDNNNCQSANTQVTLNNPPALTVNIAATPSCKGLNNGRLVATASSGSPVFTWSTGASGSTINNVGPGTYTVTVINGTCPSVTASGVVSEVEVKVIASATSASCNNNNDGTATAAATGGSGALSYTWNNGVNTPSIINLSGGDYTVIVRDAIGCEATETVTVNKDTTSNDANFGFHVAGPIVSFADSSNKAVWWNWDFGNGSSSAEQNPKHTYAGEGKYIVTLIIKNDKGCWSETMREVVVEEDFLISNVFTPNGDGFNDWFYIMVPGFNEISIEIFNRWGVKVWEITAPEIRWDGKTATGLPLPEGTYYFVFNASAPGKSQSKSGFFTLLR
jgi:gliding motility-associated-like protein